VVGKRKTVTAEINAKLDQILRNQERDEAIVRSLALMIETQNTHTEMLAKLLETAGSESPEGQDLAELLQRMLEAR
jgi:low affinity Fe/Cu permease